MKKVTSIVLNGFTNDSRVLKENLSLKKAGYEVEILALHKKGLKLFEIIEGIPVHRLNASTRNLIQEDQTVDIEKIVNIDSENKETMEIKLKNENIEGFEDLEEIENIKYEEKDIIDETNYLSSNSKLLSNENVILRNDIDGEDKELSNIKKIVGSFKKIRRMMIRQVKLFIGWLRKGKRKIVNFKNKFLNKFFKLHKLKFNLLFARKCKDSDIIHCNDLLTLPMGVIVKKFYNKDVKIVYDAHEYETELNGLKGGKKRFRKLLEKSLIKYADKVITVSNSIAEEYVRLYGIEKPSLVLNTPPHTAIVKQDIFRETFGIKKSQTIFLYQGGLVNGRGIEDILASFKEINNENSVIVFMGYGVFEDTIKEASKQYNNIFFHSAVSPSVLLNYTSSADFGISMIEDICLSYRYCLPNKMFEYIMAEVPVIVSNLPEMKNVIDTHKVGVVANGTDRKSLEDAIIVATKLDKKTLNKNIKNAKKIFNWEEQEKVLLKVYHDLYT